MKLEQAKRLYRTWKTHPDLINTEQVIPVIEAYIRLLKKAGDELKKEKARRKKKAWNYAQNVPMYSLVDMLTQM